MSQNEFKAETQRTSEATDLWRFRRSRLIGPRRKILSGCLVLGVAVTASAMIGLSSLGAEELLLLIPAITLSIFFRVGVGLSAYITGASSIVSPGAYSRGLFAPGT